MISQWGLRMELYESWVCRHQPKKAEDGSTLPSLSLVLRHLCRPHSSAIERMKWSEDGRFLATAGKDGAIFIFDGNREDKGGDGGEEDCKKTCELLKPLGCFLISGNAGDVINVVTSIQWIGDDNNHLLYESADGKQWEADVTALIFSTEKQKSISLEVGDPFLRTDIPIKLEEKRKVEGKLNPQSASIYAALVQNIGPKVIFGTSYDDKFLLVADQDGVLAIYRHTSQSPGIPLSSEKKDADGDDHCTHSVLLPSSCIFIKGFPEGSTDLPLGAERSAAIPIVFPPSKCAVHGNTPMIDRLGNSLYTIREVSRRTAEIHRLDTAHKRKDAVRAVVKEMRIEFEELSRKNEGLPAFARLSDEEMTVDPDLVAVWRAEGQGALEEVRRSCEYGQEVSLKKLKKMKTKFLDGMEFESMAVYGIGNRLVARNFPFQKLPKEVQEILNTGPTITGKETESCDLDDNGIKGEKKISNDSTLLSKLEEVNPQENDGTTKTRLQFERKKEISNDSGSSEEKQAMFFVRKEMRQARKQELASLLKCKPSENLDDPSDIAAINLATLTLGNFLLKSSTDYIGQEKMDVQHKLHQMALIAKFMYTKKYQFNQRILTVRDRKAELLKQMDEARQRLLTINNELKKPLPTTQLTWKTIPRPQRDEFPGGRGHFHKNDYNVYILSLEVEGGDDLRAVVSEDLHLPLEVDLNNLEERCVVGEEENKEQMDTMIKTVKTAPSTAPKMTCMKSTEGDDKISNANGADNGDVNDDGAGDEGADEKDTDGGEKSICSIARRHNKLEKIVRLQRERTRICSQVDASIKSFDDDISSLRRERSRLIKDLKMGELSLLTKDRELSLLQGYEHPGRLLSDRLQRIRGERSEISEKIQECAMRIDEKNTERDKAVRKDKVLKEEFLAMAPPQHACHDYFNRIYLKSRKKVLRYMKYAANNHKKSSSGESEDSEYNTDDEGDSESDFESDEDEEEKCPSEGCTEDNFQQILSFREKRWEQEEEYSTIQKELKDIMRERVQLMTRDACIVKEKQGVETEIRDLQQRKQNQFNKLHVFVPLSCSQIHLWDKKENSGTLSQKEKAENSASDTLLEKKDIVITKRTLKSSARLDECVTISSNKFTALRGRIHELRHEIIDASAAFKDLQKERSKLQKQGISKESAIESKKQKCEQLQRLKFGSLVDFDLLDKISERVPQDNDDTEIAERRRKHDRSMGDLNKKRMHLKGRLATFTETNTELLSKIRELSSRQLFLKKELKEKKIGGRKANSAPKEKGAVNCITEAVKKNLSKNNILFKTPTSIADGTVPTRLFDDQNKLEVKIKLQQKKIRSLVDEIHALRGIPPYYEQND
mmetsp:Transcript_18089/g.41137  ORF Transcript_18089/g.41137 Transcript_18089/m.41137 type:complete len:1343 (-) Transcript_18089:795-4823(-)